MPGRVTHPRIPQFLVTLCVAFVVAGCGQKRTPQSTQQAPASSQGKPGRQSEAVQLAIVQGIDSTHHDSALQSELHHLDPQADNWDTEAFSGQALKQLAKLAELARHVDFDDKRKEIEAILATAFECSRLRPETLDNVFQDGSYSVYRFVPLAPDSTDVTFAGSNGFRDALHQMRSDIGTDAPLDFHFKIVRVSQSHDIFETQVLVEFETESGQQGIIQQSAKWTCKWSYDGTAPKLLSISIDEFEEVSVPHKTFSDDTGTILGLNRCYSDQLIFGSDHWRQTLDWRFGLEIAGPHGLAVADVNGDGLDDVYYCETGGLPNRLFIQMADGTAQDRSAASGLDYLEPTQSALFVDLDNDGDQDAILASGRYVLFMQNDGTGQFSRQAIHSTSAMIRSMAAADFDSDNDLDIYFCGYFPREAVGEGVGLGRPIPYHDANNGVGNFLLANRGGWNFEDVTESVGLEANNRRFSFAASWEDYDNDGDSDLYVANDFGRNNLYRNDNGSFVDVAQSAGVEDMSSGMSVSWGDYDHDGNMDVYVGNMFSSAGNRITYQRRFLDTEGAAARSPLQRHARGNTLFRNRGDGSFEDVSVDANVTMGRWSWGANFVDINNDGWDDLLIGNGMVTSADDPDDL